MIAETVILFTAWWTLPPWIKQLSAGLFMPSFLRRKNPNEEYFAKGLKNRFRCCKILNRGNDVAMRSEEHAPKAETLMGLIKRYLVVLDEIWESVTEKGCKKPGLLEVFAFFALMRQLKTTRAQERDRRYQEDSIGEEDPNALLSELVEPCEFTKLAYKEDGKFIRRRLKKYGFELLSFELNDSPGTTSYFIAVHHQRRQAYIAVKGTNRLSDFLTNFCARSFPCNLQGPFVEGGDHSMFAHEGIALLSRTLVDEIAPIVENFLLPGGYKTSVVGHSLGGSVACGIGILLRSRLGVRHPEILRDNGAIINVVACAPAPYVDINAARQCSSFITCVVNNSDLVVRASTQNTIMGMHFLKTIRRTLEDKHSWPRGVPSLIRFARALRSSEPFMTMAEVKSGMQLAHGAALGDGVDNLYVPGKVLHMYNLWDATNGRKGKQIVMTDGMSMALQMLEFDDRCQFVKDHMINPYVREIQQLAAEGVKKTELKNYDHVEGLEGCLTSELNDFAAMRKRNSGRFLRRVSSCIGTR